jgi:N,N'-diacetylchitobiose phosphorylase
MKFYDALCPYYQNDKIEIREAEPYSYCQFIVGKDHTAFGRARHPFMTGTGGWAYFAATRFMLGIRPQFDCLEIDPCIPSEWEEFKVIREWRGATYDIHISNPNHVMKGIKEIYLNGLQVESLKEQPANTVHMVKVIMG